MINDYDKAPEHAVFICLCLLYKVYIQFIFNGFEARLVDEVGNFQSLFSGFWMTSSVIVFHSLQDVHCPCHLAY